jgi:FKBP-type peptidyl-prolyl cis-trans isomerase 2
MQVKQGDKVAVHYKGTLNDGTLFDSSEGRDPLEFEAGSGMVIPGFDNAVIGMAIGEKKKVNIPMDEAYGAVNEEMIFSVPRAEVPEDIDPQLGIQLELTNEEGEIIPVQVIDVTDEHITLNANHPLAGQDLNFELEIVAIA